MVRFRLYISFLLILIFPVFVGAQGNYNLYGLRGIPQSGFENPAFMPEETAFTMAIPLLSGISANAYNSAFSFDDLFYKTTENDSLYLDMKPLLSKNRGLNRASFRFEQDLLYFGVQSGYSFISFGIKQRGSVNILYQDDLLRLLWEGNSTKDTLDLSNSLLNEMHMIDYHFGLAFPAGRNLLLGFRVHLLQGLSNISFDRSNLSLVTAQSAGTVYNLRANTDFLLNSSGWSNLTGSDSTGNSYYFGLANTGFALDFGFDARLSDQFRLTASLLDLGSVTWRNDIKSYGAKTDSVEFGGITYDLMNDTGLITRFVDTLKNLISLKTDTVNYGTSLTPRMTAGLEFMSMNSKDRLSFLFAGRFAKTGFEPAAAFAYDRKVSEHFTYKLSYTWLPHAPLNFGAGMVVDANPFQFYILTDNVFQLFFPTRQRFFQFSFGINIKIRGYRRLPPEVASPPPVTNRPKPKIPEIVDFK